MGALEYSRQTIPRAPQATAELQKCYTAWAIAGRMASSPLRCLDFYTKIKAPENFFLSPIFYRIFHAKEFNHFWILPHSPQGLTHRMRVLWEQTAASPPGSSFLRGGLQPKALLLLHLPNRSSCAYNLLQMDTWGWCRVRVDGCCPGDVTWFLF